MRTVKTSSGATAVQVVWSSRRRSREVEHLGSAHDEAQLEALKAVALQRIAGGQLEFGPGLQPAGGRPLPITSSRMGRSRPMRSRGGGSGCRTPARCTPGSARPEAGKRDYPWLADAHVTPALRSNSMLITRYRSVRASQRFPCPLALGQ
jgi:hypothetical protein